MARQKKDDITTEIQAEPAEAKDTSKSELEEAALARVCKALGVDPNKVKESEENLDVSAEMMNYDLGKSEVHINGKRFTGKGSATRGEVEVITHAANARRMRLLNEQVGPDSIDEVTSSSASSSAYLGAR